VAQKIRDSTVGTGRAYSNKRSRKDKYSNSPKLPVRTRKERRKNEKGLICNGYQ